MMGKNTLATRLVGLMTVGALAFSLVPGLAFAAPTKDEALKTIADAMKIADSSLFDDSAKAKVLEAASVLSKSDYGDNTAAYAFALEIQLEKAQADKLEAEQSASDAESKVTLAEAKAAEAESKAKDSAAEAKAAKSELSSANKQIAKLSSQLANAQSSAAASDKILIKSVKVSGLTAKGGSGSATLSWKVSNAISGLKYQVKYRKSGTGSWSKATSKKTSYTVSGLKKNTSYQFKVRAFKKISGKRVYTSYTAVAVAKALQTYKTGEYKVDEPAGINVRAKKSTGSAVLTALKNGTKVTVEKVATSSNGDIWGRVQVKVGNDTKAGYVLMSLLKAA